MKGHYQKQKEQKKILYEEHTLPIAMSKKNVITKRKLGWSDEMVSTVALGTMTFGVQNTEEEGHEQVRPSQPDKCSAMK